MNAYTFVVVLVGGSEIERTYVAETEKEARKTCWASLNDAERDSAESVECVECKLLDVVFEDRG
jgi:hypothetical protein